MFLLTLYLGTFGEFWLYFKIVDFQLSHLEFTHGFLISPMGRTLVLAFSTISTGIVLSAILFAYKIFANILWGDLKKIGSTNNQLVKKRYPKTILQQLVTSFNAIVCIAILSVFAIWLNSLLLGITHTHSDFANKFLPLYRRDNFIFIFCCLTGLAIYLPLFQLLEFFLNSAGKQR